MTEEALEWLDNYWRRKREHLSIRRERTRKVEAGLNASRSDLVFGAVRSEPNRYRLARITVRAARAFHVQSERMETTISDSLRRVGSAKKPALSEMPPGPSAPSEGGLRNAS